MSDVNVEVVDIRKITGDGKLKAFADVKIADAIVVKGFSVMEGSRGVFVSLPRKAGRDGKWFNTIQPMSESFEQHLKNKVMEAFDRETDGVI
jgi:stage V sporulation protein G